MRSSQRCPNCGAEVAASDALVPLEAQRRIAELEEQLTNVTNKATAAVDKHADYEDELRQLKSSRRPTIDATASDTHLLTFHQAPAPKDRSHSVVDVGRRPSLIQSRLSSLLGARRSISFAPGQADLQMALAREQHARREAETQLQAMNEEVIELTEKLFKEAGEMVAKEAREKDRLMQRVGELERREGEKRGRMERLEEAVRRIEKVRGLLGERGWENRSG